MRNKIYIARTDALNDESVFQRLYDSASPYRRRKTERLIFRKDKMLSLAAEKLLSIALADNGITDFSVVYGENGKPYLRNNELYFSLSHSGDMVMCAISEAEIGADTEKVTEIDLDIAKRYFYPEEYEMLTKIETDAERRDMFFRLWTLKESYAKALGIGMLLPFDSFCIDIKNGNITVRQTANNGKFFFKEYELNDGYKYSVCGLFPQFEENIAVVSLK